jgi:predicted TIM-barrel fold metal-dependent hydrolase
MLIDCHTHAFADKIAEKAVAQLIDYYQIPTGFGGRLSDLLKVAVEAKLDALIMLVAATKPEQVKPANDWALALKKADPLELETKYELRALPQIVPFGAYHPDDPNWLNEIQRLRDTKVKGIKLHPEFQGIDLADLRLRDFWAEIESDFIVMIHVGDPVHSESNHSTPRKIAAILDNFPKLKVIAAHMGGYLFWNEAYDILAGRDLYLDTSSTLPYIDPGLLQKLISKHGTGKVLFGSDYPLRSPAQDLELFERMDWLTAAEKDRIFGLNCAELLEL